jgi:hypothetical protein
VKKKERRKVTKERKGDFYERKSKSKRKWNYYGCACNYNYINFDSGGDNNRHVKE